MAARHTSTWGEPDCNEWLRTEPGTRDWLLGYLPGMTMAWAAEDKSPAYPLKALASLEEPFLWMDSFCRANPRQTVGRGAIVLFFELVGRKEGK